MSRRSFALALMLVLLSAGVTHAQRPAKGRTVARDGAAAQEFAARVNRYVKDRKEKAGTLPAQTKSASHLLESRERMRARIEAQRATAKQGDIFTPSIAAYFHKQIASTFQGAAGTRVLQSLRRSEPVKPIPLRVNQPYPDGVALQSMPPTLLLKLPKLPKELEYRIVGRNLVLLDAAPNLVVDILPDAVPAT